MYKLPALSEKEVAAYSETEESPERDNTGRAHKHAKVGCTSISGGGTAHACHTPTSCVLPASPVSAAHVFPDALHTPRDTTRDTSLLMIIHRPRHRI